MSLHLRFSCLGLFLLATLQLGSFTAHATDTVIISEFLASNSGGLRDEDGDASDWIEIFNGGTTTINLNGWYLTDSPSDLAQWRFPSTSVPPGGFLVVFASGKNRAITGAPLHTSFKLDAMGEYLALVHPDGYTVASEFRPAYPQQYVNVSYGIAQDLRVTKLISNTAPAMVLVPTNGNLGISWAAPPFDDTQWRRGTNGIGYETYVPGFAVRNIRANSSVCDMDTANSVATNASQQAAVFSVNSPVVNYLNTSSGANFGNDFTFPGFTIGVDENNFVTEATGIITIPTGGTWTFGVNSDDGFTATIGSYSFSFPSPRGPGDTFGTFNLAAGDYPVRLVFYECGGGSELEFFAASGTKTAFDSTFRLVGDSGNGGLAVKSLPSGPVSSSLRPSIATDVQSLMYLRASSAYIRLPFTVADPSVFSTLTLRMKYNDGFVAWLNGTEVARRNAPASPLWNSKATASRANTNSIVFENIDVTSYLNLLQAGSNVLAIHGLNDATNSSSFLIQAELVENKVLGLTNHYFGSSTPGTANSSESFALVDRLHFTPGRGWYGNNFWLSITSTTPGITIRYTTNGSTPTLTNGWLYTGPIRIGCTVAVRAAGFRSGFEPTETETHTYIYVDQVQRQSTNSNYPGGSAGDYTLNTAITQNALYRDTFTNDLLAIPTLSIAIANEDFFGPNGIWSNPTARGIAWERPCSIEYMYPDGQEGFRVNCGLRIQGGASRSMSIKRSLRVLFKSVYGPSKLKYEMFPDSPVREFDSLILDAGFNDQWLWGGAPTTMHRDQWCRDAQNAMSGYGPHGVYAHLYVNGIYWGLHNIAERGDSTFAASYLGGEKEEYDAITMDGLEDGDMNAWNTMFAIARAGITNDTAYNSLAAYLNIPNFIDYLLMNFYAANTDWPHNNWKAARRRLPGATFHFFCWDAEWTFGIGSDINTDRTGINNGAPGELYAALRAHSEFRREFADHAQRHLFNNGVMTPSPAQALWDTRADEIADAIIPELARWTTGTTYSPATWSTAEMQVRSWFPQRATILINQLRNAGMYPQLAAPNFAPYGGLVTPGYSLVLTNPNSAGSIYYTLDGSDPRLWGGALSAKARLYSTPLVLTNAVAFRARVRDGANWSALVEATFYVVQDFHSLVVTEIMYRPPNFGLTNGDDLEFLELKNTGATTLDLSGLTFTDGITFTFTNGTRLGPGQFFVLARDRAAFAAKYPGITVHGLYEGKLDNGGEKLTLAHLLGTNVFSFTYDNSPPWPITPDGYGFSLVLADPAGDSDQPSTWRPSANPGGSPGANDPLISIPPILINEILTHTAPPTVDAIELFNPTAASVDLGGWFLTDDALLPKKFRIPDGTIIPAGGYLAFTEADFNPEPGMPRNFALSAQGESLFLFSGNTVSNLTGYSHSLDFGAAASGVSFGRYVISTGEEQWPAQFAVTLGNINSGPLVGPIVINEIMYHPPAGYDEFIELYNNSASDVLLSDPVYTTNSWKLSGLNYTFSNNVSLPAGGYLLLVGSDPVAFRSKYSVPWSTPILGPYLGLLQDSGERLRLARPDVPVLGTNGVIEVPYITVDEVRYNDKFPWPVSADGDGPSLQRRAPTDYGNEPTNWFASGITPGMLNTLNEAPICSLISPADGATYNFPANVELRAAASDPDGLLERVEFFEGEVKVGEAGTAPYTYNWINVPGGTHTIIAKARDNRLAVTTSTPVTFTVNPPPIGNGTGLSAQYFDNVDFTGSSVFRIDPVVDFDWGTGQPHPSIGADSFSVRWTGRVQPRFSESYTFYTVSDDGVRLWVNNRLMVDNWTDHGITENSGVIALQAGMLYEIRMEMYENGGGATARLWWSAPSVPKGTIPSTQLYLPAASNLPPVATLTSPVADEQFVAGSTIRLAATASDMDGVIAKMEFFAGSSKLGEDSALPYELFWTSATPGIQSLRAVATDDAGARGTSAPVAITILAGYVTNVSLIPTGSVWKYRDTGEDLGSTWSTIWYAENGWSNGPAQFGYGQGDEQTIVSYGPNATQKYVTTYFRRSFNISDLTLFTGLNFRVMRDDGVIVYLNGSEVFRDNLPPGAINYLTLASSDVTGDAENIWLTNTIHPGYLLHGNNVLAVEIHQSSRTNADLSFDFELTGEQTFVAPYITAQPQVASVSEGDSALLSVTAGGTAPLSYQWQFNNLDLTNETNPTLQLTNLQPSQQGNYRVLVSNVAGTVLSATAFLTVRPPVYYPVTFAQQPQGVTLRGSTNVNFYAQTFTNHTFSIVATGTYPIRIQWLKNGSIIPGATNDSLTIYNASLADEAAYRASGSNRVGTVLSDPATLRIGVNPVILQQSQSVTVTAGGSASFSVQVRSYPLPFGYTWRREGLALTNFLVAQSNSSFSVTGASSTHAGAYTVIVTNSAFTTPFVVSSNAYLTVVLPPTNQTASIGSNATFRVVATAGAYTSRLRYQWQFKGADLLGSTNSTLTISNVQAADLGIYTVLVINPVNEPTAFSAQLVTTPPIIAQQPQSVSLRATNNPAYFGQTFSNVTFSVLVNGTTPISYQWLHNGQPILGAASPTLTIQNASLPDEGMYSVIASNAMGPVTSQAASLSITVTPVIFTQPQSVTVVTGSTAVLSMAVGGQPLPLGYNWRKNGLTLTNMVLADTNCALVLTNIAEGDSGVYSVVVTNSAYSMPFAVSSNAFVTVVIPPANLSVDAGSNVTFGISAFAGPQTSKLTYQWQFKGTNIPNATNTILSLTNIQVTQQGTYSVVVTNPINWPAIFSAELRVTGAPDADSDGDGLPDWWETAHGLNPGHADANEDPDRDGMSNLEEFRAGTDPQDSQSYLKVDQISLANGSYELQFFAVSNRTYRLLWNTALQVAGWQKLHDISSLPTNRVERIVDTNSAPVLRFYRLVTPAEP